MASKRTLGLLICFTVLGALLAALPAGADPPVPVEELRPLLASTDAEVRLQALKDLRRVSWPREDAVYAEVLALLDDSDGSVRAYAAYHAYRHRDPDLAKSALIDVLSGGDDAACYDATIVLLSIELDDQDLVPLLWEQIDHPNKYVRAHSLTMLHSRFAAADPARLPALRNIMESDDYPVARAAAVKLIGDLAPEHEAAREALIAALDQGDSGVVTEASRQLIDLGPAAAPAIPKLVGYLEHQCYDCLFKGVSDVLVELAAVPELRPRITDELLRLLKSDDKYHVHRASKIFAEIETDDPRVREVALQQLGAGVWELRQLGARLLIDVFLDDPATLPPLIELLADRDKYVREYAELALAARGAQAAAAIPALLDNLEHFYPPVRVNAVSALAATGSADAAVLAGIRAALADGDDTVVLEAAAALIELEQADQQVRGVLAALAQSADEDTAEQAGRLQQSMEGK